MLDTDENQDLADDQLSPTHRKEQADKEKFDDLIEQGSSPEEIAGMENSAIDGAIDDRTSPQDRDEKDKVASQTGEPDFFRQEAEKNEGKGKISAYVKRNKGKIGLGALLLGGGGFGLFGMLAGPLQFIQIAKLLQGFHFASQEDLSDDRMMKIARYIRYKDKPEKTRLGILGNSYADRLEKRMNKSGIESRYSERLGFEDGYIIDPERMPPGSELGNDIRGSPPEEVKAKLVSHYDVPLGNIDTYSVPGKVIVSSDGLGYFGKKRLIKVSLQDAGYSKIGSAIRSRIMGRRGGVDWHPIKKLDRKVLETLDARLKKWTADRENKMNNGNPDNTTLATDDTKDTTGDDKPDPASEEQKTVAEEAKKIQDPSGDTTPGTSAVDAEVSRVRGKIKAATGVSAVVGILCLAQDLSNRYDDVKHDAVVLPLMRLGVEGMAVGNQIITGQDVDGEQMGFLAKKLYTDEDGSWAAARSIQHEMDKDLTGPDILPEAAISASKNVLAEILDNPVINGMCEVVNSTIGQIASFALDVFTGPFSAIAGQTFSQLLAPKLMDGLVRWLAGHPIDVNVSGANYGNYINYGARLAANDSLIASGGTELDGDSALELKQLRLANEAKARQEKGLLARLFDPTDATSITGSFMSEQAPDPAQNIARVASSVPSSIANIFKVPFSFGQKKAKALSNYDYGFPEYGYSVAEINREEVKNPFDNAKEVVTLLEGSGGDGYRARTEKCFGIKLQSDGAVRSTGQVPKYKDIGGDCKDKGLEWLRIRFYIMDSQLMEAYACYENDTASCEEFGLSGTPESDSTSATGYATVKDLSCDGYNKITSKPAVIVNGVPTNKTQVSYGEVIRSACATRKAECLAGVSGTNKILCSAFEFSDVYYGSNTLIESGKEAYGFTVETNANRGPAEWLSTRKPGLNPYNVLECSALTSVAIYKAFNYSLTNTCSGSYSQGARPDLFKEIPIGEIRPGDFLSTTKGCNVGPDAVAGSHLAIAASTVDSNNRVVIYETSGHGKTTHFRVEDMSYFKDGNHSRWIGPGL